MISFSGCDDNQTSADTSVKSHCLRQHLKLKRKKKKFSSFE